MKYFFSLIVFVLLTCFSLFAFANENKINLSKYLGLWHEQARLPTFFQKNCDSSSAFYSLNDDGSIKVLNSCYRLDGSSNYIEGEAKISDTDLNSRSLIVSFNFITSLINFFKGVNYYIYFVDESYNYAIVGTPQKSMLWLLTREQIITKESLDKLVKIAKDYGFDTSEIIYDKRALQEKK